MVRAIYRITPNGSRWELKHAGVLLYSHDDKAPVVSQGQTTARNNPPSQLVVHRANGTIEYEYTYGDDPFPPPG